MKINLSVSDTPCLSIVSIARRLLAVRQQQLTSWLGAKTFIARMPTRRLLDDFQRQMGADSALSQQGK